MDDSRKSRDQLIQELAAARSRIAELEGHADDPGLPPMRQALDTIETAMFLKDEAHRFVYMNRAAQGLIDRYRNGVHADTAHDLLDKAEADMTYAEDDQVLAGQGPVVREFVVELDGRDHNLVSCKNAFTDPATGKRFIAGTITDLSNVRAAETALDQALARTIALADSLPVLIHAHGDDGTFVFWNQECSRVLGYTSQEIVGNPGALDLLYPDPEDKRTIWRIRNKSEPLHFLEVRTTAKDGSKRVISWNRIKGLPPCPGWTRWEVGIDVTERRSAEEALRTSEERYRVLFQGLGDGMVLHDETGRILDANPAMLELTGHSLNELLAMTLEDLQTPAAKENGAKALALLKAKGAAQEELDLTRAGGEVFRAALSSTRIQVGGRVLYQAMVRDVTERRKNEQALMESMLHYRSLFENTGAATIIFDHHGLIQSCNTRFEKLSGRSRQEVENRLKLSDLVDPEDQGRLLGYLDQPPAGGQSPREFDFTLTDRHGAKRSVHLTMDLVPGTKDQVASLVDVTELHRALEAADQSKRLLESTVATLREAVLLLDAETLKVMDVNPAAARIFRCSRSELLGRDAASLCATAEDAVLFQEVSKQEPKEGAGFIRRENMLLVCHDGAVFPAEATVSPMARESGRVATILAVIRDMSRNRRQEQQLRESRERFRLLSEASFAGVAVFVNKVLVEANDQYFEMFGMPQRELLGRQALRKTLTQEDHEFILERMQLGEPGPFEATGLRKDDSSLPLEIRFRTMDYHGQPAQVAVLMDITERKRAESALRESAERLTTVVDLMPILVHAHDTDGTYVFWNKECERVLGFSAEEVIGCPTIWEKLYPGPDYRRNVLEYYHKEVVDFTELITPVTTKSGDVRVIAWSSRSSHAPIPGWASWETGVDITEQHRARQELARLNRHLEELVAERTHDLDAKARELAQVNALLIEMDEMKSAMLSTVTHDLRTPLTSVLGFVKLIRRDFARHFLPLARDTGKLAAKGERIHANLEIIESEAERLTRLINDFLDLTRIEAGKADFFDTSVDPAALAAQASQSLSGALVEKPGVSFVLHVGRNLPTMRLDPDRILQVLANLLSNAVKYTESGKVTLSVTAEGKILRLTVTDTGPGIPDSDLERIFEKFYRVNTDTLPGSPEGSGMGLAICRRIVEHYRGRIWAESEPGKGSTFIVELPVEPQDKPPALPA